MYSCRAYALVSDVFQRHVLFSKQKKKNSCFIYKIIYLARRSSSTPLFIVGKHNVPTVRVMRNFFPQAWITKMCLIRHRTSTRATRPSNTVVRRLSTIAVPLLQQQRNHTQSTSEWCSHIRSYTPPLPPRPPAQVYQSPKTSSLCCGEPYGISAKLPLFSSTN